MTVGEFVRQVNLVLGDPELSERRIVRTVSVGQDFGSGDELAAVLYYLDTGLGVRPDAPSAFSVSDARCDER
jgi:hypothetical protein